MSESTNYGHEGDLSLWRDLLRRANGDTQVATKWMNEIGAGSPSANSAGLQKDFDLAAAEAGAPATFYCPISFRVLRDPVMLPTGQTYERQMLATWLALGNSTCPATGQTLPQPITVVPNVELRRSIEAWCATNVPWILDMEGHLKPIDAEDDDLKATQMGRSALIPPLDDDLTLAISLQEDELEQYSARSAPLQQILPCRGRERLYRERQEISTSPFTLLNCLLLATTIGCTVVFVLSLWQNSWDVENLSSNPLVGPSALALSRLGSRVSSKINDQHQWWRILTSLFVSSGVIHLFGVITSLWTLGKYLERVVLLPGLTVPLLYLVSGMAGAVVSASLAYNLDSAGASAGVCGLLGAVWMEQIVNWQLYTNQLATLVVLVVITGMFVVISLLPLVGMWFQVVALFSGALLSPSVLYHPAGEHQRQSWICFRWLLKLAGLGVVIAVIAIGVVSILANKAKIGQSCGWCATIDCANTEWWSCAQAGPLQPQASCVFKENSNSTTSITCPSGSVYLVASSSVTNQIASCNTACSTVTAFAPPAAGPGLAPNNAGVLI